MSYRFRLFRRLPVLVLAVALVTPTSLAAMTNQAQRCEHEGHACHQFVPACCCDAPQAAQAGPASPAGGRAEVTSAALSLIPPFFVIPANTDTRSLVGHIALGPYSSPPINRPILLSVLLI